MNYQIFSQSDTLSRPKSGLESRLESGLESETSKKVLLQLNQHAFSRSELADALGHGKISGAVNRAIKELLKKQFIEQTLPEKPNSRLQKYRLTPNGRNLLKPEAHHAE